MERNTGDPVLDFLLVAGPRTVTPDVPKHILEEIRIRPALGWYKQAMLGLAQEEQASILRDVERISQENRLIEHKAVNGLGLPYARFPLSMVAKFEAIYGKGCWRDKEFVEDTLKHHPGLQLIVKRGTRGQEYVNGRRR
jgi:hypothetical protein